MIRHRTRIHILALITLFVLAADAWIWGYAISVRRDPAYRYRAAGVAELYIPSERQRISGFRILAEDRLEIRLVPAPPTHSRWAIRVDGEDAGGCDARYPRLPLRTEAHRYTVRNTAKPDLSFTIEIDYYPHELYARYNATIGDTYRVVSASLPVGNYATLPVASFVDQDVPAGQRRQVEQILARDVGIRGNDPGRVKVEKIGRFLLAALDSRRGIPAPDLDPSPLGSYQCARAGTSAIWCDQFARIFALFANVAGVPTRLVSVTGRLDGVMLGAHGFDESFLAESGRWAYVDLFSRVVLVEDAQGRLLNAVDLLMLQRAGVTSGVTALAFRDGRLQRLPYREVAPEIGRYLAPDATLVYSRGPLSLPGARQRLQRAVRTLLVPDLAFSLATPPGSRYLLTVLLGWSGLALLLFWLLFFLRAVLRRRPG